MILTAIIVAQWIIFWGYVFVSDIVKKNALANQKDMLDAQWQQVIETEWQAGYNACAKKNRMT